MARTANCRRAWEGLTPCRIPSRCRTTDPRDVDGVANLLSRMPGIDQVSYGQGVVDKLLELTYWIRLVGLAIVVLLGLCAIFLIATTIRLTMFARRREIVIMKLVGATDWYVRWPFLLEGIILGAAGAAIAIAAAVLLIQYPGFKDHGGAALLAADEQRPGAAPVVCRAVRGGCRPGHRRQPDLRTPLSPSIAVGLSP